LSLEPRASNVFLLRRGEKSLILHFKPLNPGLYRETEASER